MNEMLLAKLEIHNVPNYAHQYNNWVVRFHNHQLWFFGAYDTKAAADKACRTMDNALVVFIPTKESNN